jgi:hypothetical protein
MNASRRLSCEYPNSLGWTANVNERVFPRWARAVSMDNNGYLAHNPSLTIFGKLFSLAAALH